MFDPLALLPYYPGEAERIGFILKSGEIVETENVCDDSQNGFDFRGEDLVEYPHRSQGSWHTHPGVSSNLSEEDRRSFLNYPELDHYIIGIDGISKYQVVNGSVIYAAAYPFSRDLQDTLS